MVTDAAIARRRRAGPAVRDPEATRERILAAATSEFARHGLGGARVDRIAIQAGANKAMLYYYFSDKDDLFRAALRRMYDGIRSAEQRLQLLDLPPLEAIERLVEFTWTYYIEHPEFLSLLNSENLHEGRHLKRFAQVRDTNSLLVATLTEVLRRGEAQKAFRPGVDALQLYISIAALGYFYLSNNHTLSQAFDRDLGSKSEYRARLAHMTAMITGFLTNRDLPKAAKRRGA
jgi:AcrR family transcriptional regulator